MTRTPSPGVACAQGQAPWGQLGRRRQRGCPVKKPHVPQPRGRSQHRRWYDGSIVVPTWRNEKGTWALRRFSLNSPSPDNSLENHQANPNWGTFYIILNPRSSELSRSSKARDVWELSVSRGASEDVTTECDVTPGRGPGTWRGQRRKSEE